MSPEQHPVARSVEGRGENPHRDSSQALGEDITVAEAATAAARTRAERTTAGVPTSDVPLAVPSVAQAAGDGMDTDDQPIVTNIVRSCF